MGFLVSTSLWQDDEDLTRGIQGWLLILLQTYGISLQLISAGNLTSFTECLDRALWHTMTMMQVRYARAAGPSWHPMPRCDGGRRNAERKQGRGAPPSRTSPCCLLRTKLTNVTDFMCSQPWMFYIPPMKLWISWLVAMGRKRAQAISAAQPVPKMKNSRSVCASCLPNSVVRVMHCLMNQSMFIGR